jgi:hypothetical protein
MDSITQTVLAYLATFVIANGMLLWGLRQIQQMIAQGFLAGALTEKAARIEPATTSAPTDTRPRAPGQPAPAAVSAAGQSPVATGPSGGPPSYSRFAGAVGAFVMAAMLAGVGNWVLFEAFKQPTALSNLTKIMPYFAGGASLFLPYAFNQLSSLFK